MRGDRMAQYAVAPAECVIECAGRYARPAAQFADVEPRLARLGKQSPSLGEDTAPPLLHHGAGVALPACDPAHLVQLHLSTRVLTGSLCRSRRACPTICASWPPGCAEIGSASCRERVCQYV